MSELLNIKNALEMIGDEKELYKELLLSFINDKVFDRSKLLSLEQKEDKIEAAKYVHLFKGAGRQIGAEQLAQSGQELEDILRGNSVGNIQDKTNRFISDYNNTISVIKETIEIL